MAQDKASGAWSGWGLRAHFSTPLGALDPVLQPLLPRDPERGAHASFNRRSTVLKYRGHGCQAANIASFALAEFSGLDLRRTIPGGRTARGDEGIMNRTSLIGRTAVAAAL